jgi:lipopolysaccharide export system permease protein
MLTLIDRQMVRGYFKSYFVCLSSLLSLYVIVDLFTNLDDFTHHKQGLKAVVEHIVSYYGYQVTKIFDRLCEAIVLLAAMFTVAWMQRNNEQVPLLSAGVSTRRIVLPVLLCACVMMSLTVLNQELVIPRIGEKLTRDRDDPGGNKDLQVHGAYEPNLIHIEGDRATRDGLVVKAFRCTIPEAVAGNLIHLTAQEARYHKGDEPHAGKWELTGCVPADLESIPNVLEVRDAGRYYLLTKSIDFEALTRNPNWFLLTSTWQLYDELQRPESTRLAAMAVLFHMRLTRPLVGMVLVFLGLSVILRDQNRNVIISSGLCLVLCGVFFAAGYACKMLGDNEYLNPALAAWLPVLTFGPFAVVMFDAVHT